MIPPTSPTHNKASLSKNNTSHHQRLNNTTPSLSQLDFFSNTHELNQQPTHKFSPLNEHKKDGGEHKETKKKEFKTRNKYDNALGEDGFEDALGKKEESKSGESQPLLTSSPLSEL